MHTYGTVPNKTTCRTRHIASALQCPITLLSSHFRFAEKS